MTHQHDNKLKRRLADLDARLFPSQLLSGGTSTSRCRSYNRGHRFPEECPSHTLSHQPHKKRRRLPKAEQFPVTQKRSEPFDTSIDPECLGIDRHTDYTFLESNLRSALFSLEMSIEFPKTARARSDGSPTHSLPMPVHTLLLARTKEELDSFSTSHEEIIIYNQSNNDSVAPQLIIQISSPQKDCSEWPKIIDNVRVVLESLLETYAPEFSDRLLVNTNGRGSNSSRGSSDSPVRGDSDSEVTSMDQSQSRKRLRLHRDQFSDPLYRQYKSDSPARPQGPNSCTQEEQEADLRKIFRLRVADILN